MLDRIILINETEALLVFTNRAPISIWSSEGLNELLTLIDGILRPLDNPNFERLSDYVKASQSESEDTIILDNISYL